MRHCVKSSNPVASVVKPGAEDQVRRSSEKNTTETKEVGELSDLNPQYFTKLT